MVKDVNLKFCMRNYVNLEGLYNLSGFSTGLLLVIFSLTLGVIVIYSRWDTVVSFVV